MKGGDYKVGKIPRFAEGGLVRSESTEQARANRDVLDRSADYGKTMFDTDGSRRVPAMEAEDKAFGESAMSSARTGHSAAKYVDQQDAAMRGAREALDEKAADRKRRSRK